MIPQPRFLPGHRALCTSGKPGIYPHVGQVYYVFAATMTDPQYIVIDDNIMAGDGTILPCNITRTYAADKFDRLVPQTQ